MTTELAVRSAVATDPGLHRSDNQDSAYASDRLLAVADGIGGHAHGEVASATAIGALADLDRRLDSQDPASVDPLAALADAVTDAGHRIVARAEADPELAGMGTTLTVLLRHGTRFAVAHIGDSRCYLLRDGELGRLTRDHTLVQTLVDDGRITDAEAHTHPRRSMLVRALLSDGSGDRPDLYWHDIRPGDRYLLCSDGLSDVVPDEDVRSALAVVEAPDVVAAHLVDLANAAGGPDNVTCVVADIHGG